MLVIPLMDGGEGSFSPQLTQTDRDNLEAGSQVGGLGPRCPARLAGEQVLVFKAWPYPPPVPRAMHGSLLPAGLLGKWSCRRCNSTARWRDPAPRPAQWCCSCRRCCIRPERTPGGGRREGRGGRRGHEPSTMLLREMVAPPTWASASQLTSTLSPLPPLTPPSLPAHLASNCPAPEVSTVPLLLLPPPPAFTPSPSLPVAPCLRLPRPRGQHAGS